MSARRIHALPTRHRKGFSATSGRGRKAQKIRIILREARGKDVSRESILDIGTGNGEIAAYFGALSPHVTSIDIENARTVAANYRFCLGCDEALPFPTHCFDIVISNHVIEHVRDPHRHIEEMARVLKNGGTAYLATPNRLWPWEYHYRLPLLHYLPANLFEKLLRAIGRFTESVRLLTYPGLVKLVRGRFDAKPFSGNVCREPRRYDMSCPVWLEKALRMVPLPFYSCTTILHPTLLFVLRKKRRDDG